MRNNRRKLRILSLLFLALFLWAIPNKARAEAPQLTDANLQTVGGQIRTVEPMGLRFLSCIKDTYIEELEQEGTVEFGTVVLPKKYLGDQELTVDGEYFYEGKIFRPAVAAAKKIFYKQDGRTYFSAVLTNISSRAYESEYIARAYVKVVKEDGTEEIIYSNEEMEKNIYQVAKDAVAGDVENSETKQWLQENVIDRIENPDSQKPPVVEEEEIAFRLGEVEFVSLFRQDEEGDVEEVGAFKETEFQPEDYIAKVEIADQPTVHAKVKELLVEGDSAKLKLDLDHYVYYEDGEKKKGAVVDFGTVKDGTISTKYVDPQALFDQMKADPSGNYTLFTNMDFSNIKTNSDQLIGKFTGTLNGNGFKITGLTNTLFGELSGAEVKNLVIEGAIINKTANEVGAGILADTATGGSVIKNVHISGSLTASRNKTGGMVGELKEKSEICYSSVNVNLSNVRSNLNVVAGGLAGETASQSKIYDSYAMGTITSLAKGAGGLVGWHRDSSIERCFAAVKLVSESQTNYPGGVIGNISDAETAPGNIQHNVSFSYGKRGYKFDGMTASAQYSEFYKDNYTLGTTPLTVDELTADSEKEGIDVTGKITEKTLDELKAKEFYTTALGWSEEVWDFSGLALGKAPKLKGIAPFEASMTQNLESVFVDPAVTMAEVEEAVAEAKEETEGTVLTQLSSIDGYQEDHQVAYGNMIKFMPFYEYEQIVKEGNKLAVDHKLNTYEVLTVYPLNEKGERVVSMTQEDTEKMTRVRVQFVEEEAAPSVYNLIYIGTQNGIASYLAEQPGIRYTFKHRIVDTGTELFKETVAKAKTYTYDNDIMNRPAGGEHNSVKKAYRNNYTNVVIPEMEQIFVSYFATQDEVPLNVDHPVAKMMAEQRMLDDEYLKDYLCSYNYIDRWYDFVIGGVNIRDVILFDNDVMGMGRDASNLPIEMCRNVQNDERWGRRTQDLYRNKIGKYTGISEVDVFVEYFMKAYARYSDVNDWIMENFEHGILLEEKPKNPDVRYWRLWERLKNNSLLRFKDMILPTLSYKTSNNLYIATTTTYIVYGNLQCYGGYQDSETWRNNMANRIRNILKEHANIFDHYATLSTRGAEGINNCRYTVVDQSLTQHRWQDVYVEYFEPLGTLFGGGGNGGAAVNVKGAEYMDYIYFNTASYINNPDTMTHELGHATDSVVYMDSKGHRRGGEDVNNGFANQAEVDYNMNLMRDYPADSDKLCNLTPDRIDTDAEFQDYYAGVFETLYTLDYLQGKAYLELTPEQQAAVTARHYYGNKNSAHESNQVNSTWRIMSASDMENMQMKTLEDLWDNRIMIRPGHRFDIASMNEVGQGNFGAYNLDRVAYASWYVPYVGWASPNGQTYRRNAYELGGVAGYAAGTQEYFRRDGGQDLERFKKITGKEDFDFKIWRMDKYKEIEEKLAAQKNLENPYFDERAVIDYLKQNLINYGNAIGSGSSTGNKTLQNVKASRENVFRYLHRVTNQFTLPIYPEDSSQQVVVEVTSGQQLADAMRQNPAGIYALKNDISMEGVTGESGCYVNQTFIGKLDGNGYQITGMTQPLLNRISNSYVEDITFANAEGTQQDSLLAKSVAMTIQIKSKKAEKEIYTLEDLKSIGKNEYETYVLKEDIDASSVTSGEALITGIFSSVLEGGGHTISGLKVPLFDSVQNGTIQNLKVKNAEIRKNADFVAAVARRTHQSVLKNLELENITVEGQSYTAAVTGRDYVGSVYERIQVRDGKIKASGTNSGVLIGRAVESKISDAAVLGGTAEVRARGTGGFIGIAKNAEIDRVYGSAELKVPAYSGDDAVAGFIGSIEGASRVNHAFAAGSVDCQVEGKEIRKFTGFPETVQTMVTASYELEGATGTDSVTEETAEKLMTATEQNQKDPAFYTGNLTFSEEIWSVRLAAQKGYPELKGMEGITTIHITGAEDVELMNQYPNQEFILDADLDFTGVQKTAPLVTDFVGTLEGNNHKIIGLNVPLFGTLRGTVSEIILEGSQVNGDGAAPVGALAVNVSGAAVNDTALHKVQISAPAGKAAAFAGTVENSQLRDIQITDSKVSAGAGDAAGFACSIAGTTAVNIVQYVQLEVAAGAEAQAACAGFAITADENSSFENLFSIGHVPVAAPKLMADVSRVTNGYELEFAAGTASEDTAHVTAVTSEIWTKSFYQDSLRLDPEKWDLTQAEALGYPVLKAVQAEYRPMKIEEIAAAGDFKKMNYFPDRTFTLVNDIDMSNYDGELVTEKFTGTLNGEYYTISGQTKSLFQELAGTVQQLTLKNVRVINAEGPANALARTTTNAKISELFVSGMALSGGSHTGLVGTDTSSIYEKVGIENVILEAKGDYAGILIAEINNEGVSSISQLKEILIGNGDVYANGQQYVGGMLGKIHGTRLNNTVCDVDLHVPLDAPMINTAAYIGGSAGNWNAYYAVILGGVYPEGVSEHKRWKAIYVADEAHPEELKQFNYSYYDEGMPGDQLNMGWQLQPPGVGMGNIRSPEFYNYISMDTAVWNIADASAKGYPTIWNMPAESCPAPELPGLGRENQ